MEWLTKFNDQLLGAPTGALVLLSCIAFGYVLRFFRRFPNEAIPLAVILWGAAFFMLLAPERQNMALRFWLARNFTIGLIIGFVAWLIHNKGLAILEDKVPFLKGLLTPTTPPPTEPPKDNTP
jgi:hypothetical protein